MKKKLKQERLNESYNSAYNQDCSEGLTGYRTSALNHMQKKVNDEKISFKDFEKEIDDIEKNF